MSTTENQPAAIVETPKKRSSTEKEIPQAPKKSKKEKEIKPNVENEKSQLSQKHFINMDPRKIRNWSRPDHPDNLNESDDSQSEYSLGDDDTTDGEGPTNYEIKTVEGDIAEDCDNIMRLAGSMVQEQNATDEKLRKAKNEQTRLVISSMSKEYLKDRRAQIRAILAKIDADIDMFFF